MSSVNLKPVLYVEDDENDVFFMQKVWKTLALPNPLEIVRDGKEAVDYFSAEPTQPANLSLILLDLNLPRQPGLDVLKWIREATSSLHIAHPHSHFVLARPGCSPGLSPGRQCLPAQTSPSQRSQRPGEGKSPISGLQRNQPPPDPREFETNPT
jgi:hypothetical protein